MISHFYGWFLSHLQFASAILLLLGVFLSIIGTYYLTHLYHSYHVGGFLFGVVRAAFLIASFQFPKVLREAKVAARVPDAEQRAKSLIGVYLIFLGFVMQAAGTVLALVDTLRVGPKTS